MQGELSVWYEKGYVVSSASIRFIVAWKPKDAPKEEKEYAVVLLDLTMNRDLHTRDTT
jgi:ATP-dependent DNA helicase RecQ